MARNDRLADALAETGLSTLRLAEQVGVDPKTAERWVAQGRVPHPRLRSLVADLLHVPRAVLWPAVDAASGTGTVTCYPSRRQVPAVLWRSLTSQARRRFDLHAFAATFLPDQVDLAADLAALAARGVQVRLLLGDPDGEAVQRRSLEEGGSGLAGRVALVLTYLAPVLGCDNIQVRLHDHTLYDSLYRFDDEMLVNVHVWGSPAAANPVLHLRSPDDDLLMGKWQDGFQRVWDQARPLDRPTTAGGRP